MSKPEKPTIDKQWETPQCRILHNQWQAYHDAVIAKHREEKRKMLERIKAALHGAGIDPRPLGSILLDISIELAKLEDQQ